MANTLIADKSFVFVGLGTLTYTIPSTGIYYVKFEITDYPPSGISILVKDNGATVFTAPVLADYQGELQFKFSSMLTAAHVITVVIASAVDVEDNQLNTVKSITSIGLGL